MTTEARANFWAGLMFGVLGGIGIGLLIAPALERVRG